MNSKFIVAIRKATRNLPPSDETVKYISDCRCELVKEVEEVILRNEDVGKRYLLSNTKELLAQKEYTETIVTARLTELMVKGLDEYNADFWNIREVSNELGDALDGLEELRKVYFDRADSIKRNEGKTVIQNADKIYNIEKIDTANFS